ncbi:MAG TPA: hypothetical protein VFD90_04665 [Gaiellales bacterium]|nr:hypothetical protein [Gaiellales bacterium]
MLLSEGSCVDATTAAPAATAATVLTPVEVVAVVGVVAAGVVTVVGGVVTVVGGVVTVVGGVVTEAAGASDVEAVGVCAVAVDEAVGVCAVVVDALVAASEMAPVTEPVAVVRVWLADDPPPPHPASIPAETTARTDTATIPRQPRRRRPITPPNASRD